MLLIDKDYKTYTVKGQSEHALKETLKKLQCEKSVPAIVLSNKEVKEYCNHLSVKTGSQLECRVGNLDKETLVFTEKSLVFGHIVVESIQVDMFYGQLRNIYEYKINTKSVDEDFSYTFSTKGSIKSFFKDVLPLLNKTMNRDCVKYSEMNLIQYNECIDDWNKYYAFFHDFTDERFDGQSYIAKMILTCGMKRNIINSLYKSVDIEVTFESDIPYNPYVEWLLNLKLENLKYRKTDDKYIYIGHYSIDSHGWISEELDLGKGEIYDSIRSYVVSDILSYVLSNLNQDYFIHGMKRINRIWSDETLDVKDSRDFLFFYNFIKEMRCWDYTDGENRVGRDDFEWKELTYVISAQTEYRIPDDLLNLINERLNIGVKFEEENLRYRFQKIYDDDRVPWLAWRKGGEVDNLNVVVKMLNVAVEFFCKTNE